MLSVGIDYHKKFSYGTIMNEKGDIIKQGMLKNSFEGVSTFINGCKGNEKIQAVMEATRNWTLMYDWLDKVVDEVKLANPLKVKVIAESSIKTDKIDSTALANLLRSNYLPEAYVATKPARDARHILRQRLFFVRMQTMLKNRIRGVLDKHPEVGKPEANDVFGKKGMEWLKSIKLPIIERKTMNSDLKLLKEIQERIAESDKLIAKIGNGDKRVKYLLSIPGIGAFFAVLICYEIDDIRRFKTDKKLHAYAGLVPSTYASGGKVFHGHITKQGNKWLRWAMVEAVWPAIRGDAELRMYYERLRRRKGANCAKVATAKRLLTIVYRILKEERYYKVHQLPSNTPGYM